MNNKRIFQAKNWWVCKQRYSAGSDSESHKKGWITLKPHGGEEDSYVHVYLDEHGSIKAGPEDMVGKKVGELSQSHSEVRDHPEKPTNPPESKTESSPKPKLSEAEERLLEQHGRKATGESRQYLHFAGHGKREKIERNPVAEVGDILQTKNGSELVVKVHPPHFISNDHIEDVDGWGQYREGPGWYQQVTRIPVERNEDEQRYHTEKTAKDNAKKRIVELGSRVRSLENHQPYATSVLTPEHKLIEGYGHAGLAGSERLYSDGKTAVVTTSSYDDAPHAWKSNDESLAKELLELNEAQKKVVKEPSATTDKRAADNQRKIDEAIANRKSQDVKQIEKQADPEPDKHLSLIEMKMKGNRPVNLHGNTFPHKEAIKALAQKVKARIQWDSRIKEWLIHSDGSTDIKALAKGLRDLEAKKVHAYSRSITDRIRTAKTLNSTIRAKYRR